MECILEQVTGTEVVNAPCHHPLPAGPGVLQDLEDQPDLGCRRDLLGP